MPTLSGTPTVSRGIIWAVACVLILGGILYVIPGKDSTPAMAPLFGGRMLRDLELDQLELSFSKSGLVGWRREDGRMLVPSESRHEFLAALEHSAALPYALQNPAASVSDGGSFFESESARKSRQQQAKAIGLGNKIAAFDDIVWASVDYDEQSAGGFRGETIQSAGVVLVSKSGKPIAPGRISMIQNLVAGAYAGMEADQVTVTDTSARKTYNGLDDPQTRQQRQAEYELEQRLTDLLSGYRGLHIAARSVYNSDETSQQDTDGKPVALSKSIAKDHGAGEFEMRVSVGVPESQFHAQWMNDYRSQHPDRSFAEAPTEKQMEAVRNKVMTNIRDAVSPLIATARNVDEQAVRVWSFPDTGSTPQYSPPQSRSLGIATWIAMARSNVSIVVPIGSLLLIALVLGGAAMRMRLRHSSTDSIATTVASAKQDIADRDAEEISVSAAEETTLRDDLAELVESNPELAAQIVHSWIADAA